MRAGQLRRRVVLEARGDGDDGFGTIIPGIGPWEERTECAARIKNLVGGETIVAGRLAGEGHANITVRANSATRQASSDWRIRDVPSGEIYQIKSIIEDEKGRLIEALTQTGVAA